MITAKDLEYHNKKSDDPTFAETYFLIFSIPEESISGNAYVLARPNIGVTLSSIYINKGICHNAYEAEFSDAPMHLAAPKKFSDFTLDNGFSLKAFDKGRNYKFNYQSRDDLCKFDLDFTGIMDPFDALDPQHNPMLEAFSNTEEATGAGDSWSQGHYDLVGRIRGELELYGKRYKVDCIDGLDRSWGPRLEWNAAPVSWMHMCLGEDLSFHLIMTLDLSSGTPTYTTFRFGYVVKDGETSGIVSATVSGENSGMLGVFRCIQIRDQKGREWEIIGSAIAAAPWHSAYGSFISFQSLYRWATGNKVGYSNVTDVVGLTTLGNTFSKIAASQR